MKLLLDTHVFLWLMSMPGKLPAAMLAACQDRDNTLLLSAASVWEIQIKHQRNKIELGVPLVQIVAEQTQGPWDFHCFSISACRWFRLSPSKHSREFSPCYRLKRDMCLQFTTNRPITTIRSTVYCWRRRALKARRLSLLML